MRHFAVHHNITPSFSHTGMTVKCSEVGNICCILSYVQCYLFKFVKLWILVAPSKSDPDGHLLGTMVLGAITSSSPDWTFRYNKFVDD